MKLWKLVRVGLVLVLCLGMVGWVTSCAFFESDDDDSNTGGTPTTPLIPTLPGGQKPGALVIDDPLTNGTSVATALLGGEFTPGGYHITAVEDNGYIMYDTSIKENIWVEFDAQGYQPGELQRDDDNVNNVLMMHDAADPYAWWPSQWRVLRECWLQVRKIGLGYWEGRALYDEMDGFLVKGGCDNGASSFEVSTYWHRMNGAPLVPNPLEWDPAKKYHWVFTVKDGRVEVFRDGVQLLWGEGFWPENRIVVYIGGVNYQPMGFSPRDVTYSNVKIYQY